MTADPGGRPRRPCEPPITAVREAVRVALVEDLGTLGDLTVSALIDPAATATAVFRTRRDGVLAGTACATEAYAQLDPALVVRWQRRDGDRLVAGDVVGSVHGSLASILTGERTALNFLCHLSGVASLTARVVDAVAATGSRTTVLDTRKTLPGLRALQKAAVRAGGGANHRESLADAILVKDNHLRGVSIAEAVRRSREAWPGRAVEIECDTLAQVAEAKAAGADIVMCDNMTPHHVREAVALLGGAALVEVSGGLGLEGIAEYAAAGADYVSIGALTHSAPSLDLGLDIDADTDE
jgi:nicotinate-nucleotide pyrophosphorylase (carboxylating)